MEKKSLAFALWIILLGFPAYTQPDFPPNYPLFDSSVVARVDITVNPDTLQWIYENVDSDIEFHAVFSFYNGTIDETVENVGFRLRGNTSRYSWKKSFKVSFNTFQQGGKFYGIEKMNLNGEHNDPSVIRSRICWDWLRAMKVPAPRSTHVEVYINDNYYGLYIMVEHIDEEFAGSRFGNKNGNLYKCLWPADLKYLGSDQELYKFESGGRRAYELTQNEELDDYSDLAHFIAVLNNTPLDELECKLEQVFNLEDYLKVMAVDIMTGNWDGYIYNKNNFYLYHNNGTGRFEYIPYDLDNTLGIDWLDRDWGNRDIYDWAQHGSETRPLYTRLLAVPEIRDRFSYYFDQLLGLLSDEDSLFAAIDQVKTMISPSVADDPYYPLDYGYTFTDFINSYNQALGGHVDYGLKPFIQTRKSTALQQLVINDIKPVVKYIKSALPLPGLEYWISAYVEDEDPMPVVRLLYQVDGAYPVYADFYDDGAHYDLLAGDKIYGCVLAPFEQGQEVTWQIIATDTHSQSTLIPCTPVMALFNPYSPPQLVINELMADNESVIADEYGEYDDWVEIYNADEEAVWLGDKYLSDDLSNPDKWLMPDLTMQPGTFLLIWADDTPAQGPKHASFKLSKDGEEIGVFGDASTGYALIDSVVFNDQAGDVSFGRQHDGEEPWVLFTEPTPGYSNGSYFIIENKPGDEVMFYPNPAGGETITFFEPFTGVLVNSMGQPCLQASDAMKLDISGLSRGIYIIIGIKGEKAKLIVK